ncbi:uncharacterized protein EV422DRAFT_163145 [Fimicolochytrium jonesii]|uniref:uncharacterized protein n=1 Tax=Fimicolochytrium jonesii TaxID=1396493 RepID=UPI0022FF26FC|nr:uncharacterized protein EV422DRAFT_163145 [Fimicolochytrium jonesii]KAI8818734.1 hypothetical protein EV422DRAFT_163145 [Fimicolochytrium jonesii]
MSGGPVNPLTYQPAQVHLDQVVKSENGETFAPSPIRPYSINNELERLRLGEEIFPNTIPTNNLIEGGSGGFQSFGDSSLTPRSAYSNQATGGTHSGSSYSGNGGGQPSQAASEAWSALQQGLGNNPNNGTIGGHDHSAYAYGTAASNSGGVNKSLFGRNHTDVKADPQTHTVTLSTTTYQPRDNKVVEAVDTYTYRRPETTNGEYGNFPRRGHNEHFVNGGQVDQLYAHGGKAVKNGDKVVPLGGPGYSEERPGLARHGGNLV